MEQQEQQQHQNQRENLPTIPTVTPSCSGATISNHRTHVQQSVPQQPGAPSPRPTSTSAHNPSYTRNVVGKVVQKHGGVHVAHRLEIWWKGANEDSEDGSEATVLVPSVSEIAEEMSRIHMFLRFKIWERICWVCW